MDPFHVGSSLSLSQPDLLLTTPQFLYYGDQVPGVWINQESKTHVFWACVFGEWIAGYLGILTSGSVKGILKLSIEEIRNSSNGPTSTPLTQNQPKSQNLISLFQPNSSLNPNFINWFLFIHTGTELDPIKTGQLGLSRLLNHLYNAEILSPIAKMWPFWGWYFEL